MKSFNEVFEDKTKYGTKIKTSEYCEMGAHLIIDQGQEQVAGYTDIEEGVFEEVPVIIFGDHTRVIKYVDKPFFLGADGVKVLRSKFKNANYKYLYYALKNARIPNTGYNRHFKWLKEVQIEYPDYRRQENVVKILDKVSDLIETRQHEIKRLDDLIKARFVEMFGSPVSNPMSWEKRTLKEVCIKLNDGSHFSPESFETGDYKYVTAKNIKFSGFDFSNITYVPEAVHRPIFDRCNPEFEDVLYIKDGATTGVAIVNTLDEEFTLLSSVALLKQDRSIMNGYFLATLLNNKDMYLNIRNNIGGAAITRLTIAKLNAIEIIVPPIELQNQFAAFVAEVDKSKFVELFGDPRDNSMGFEKQKLKDSCIVVTGNTPSRAIAEYYGDYVEWIKTDNIVTGLINPTRAKECLSEKGMEVGRIVQKDSILMTCIAGSIASIGRVCITDRTVAFNQQINAIIPDRYNVLFLYVLLQISKNYLAEDVNMALKGILSKSKLEEKQLIVPPIELQNQFADFVRQVDKSKFVVI